jgi:hypothetical protein
MGAILSVSDSILPKPDRDNSNRVLLERAINVGTLKRAASVMFIC